MRSVLRFVGVASLLSCLTARQELLYYFVLAHQTSFDVRYLRRFNLTQCINSMVVESLLPRKIVNLLFTITNRNVKLLVLRGC